MKLFKKLMAVALAGAMALTVLTGCGSSKSEETEKAERDRKKIQKPPKEPFYRMNMKNRMR